MAVLTSWKFVDVCGPGTRRVAYIASILGVGSPSCRVVAWCVGRWRRENFRSFWFSPECRGMSCWVIQLIIVGFHAILMIAYSILALVGMLYVTLWFFLGDSSTIIYWEFDAMLWIFEGSEFVYDNLVAYSGYFNKQMQFRTSLGVLRTFIISISNLCIQILY